MDGQPLHNGPRKSDDLKTMPPPSEVLPDNMDNPSTSQDREQTAVNLRNRMKAYLANMEICVEELRNKAMQLVEKKETLVSSVDVLKNNDPDMQLLTNADRDEIATTMERINARLDTIQLSVLTVRSAAQQEALDHVNAKINDLIRVGNYALARRMCQKFLNTCQYARQIGDIFVDVGFDDAWRECTADDQKKIQKRLVALMDYYSTKN